MIYWLVCRHPDVESGDGWLGASERRLQEPLRVPKRRNDWRLGRWTAKQAIRAWLRIAGDEEDANALEILPDSCGAPVVLRGGSPFPVSVSISHSAGAGFCVIGPRDSILGCDAELVQPRDEGLLSDFFLFDEAALVRGARVEERAVLANLIWSAKESALKAMREGMRRDTRSVRASLVPDGVEGGWTSLRVRCLESAREFAGWWRLDHDLALTVVADPPSPPPLPLR